MITKIVQYKIPNGEVYDSYEMAEDQVLKNLYYALRENLQQHLSQTVENQNYVQRICKGITKDMQTAKSLHLLLRMWLDDEPGEASADE